MPLSPRKRKPPSPKTIEGQRFELLTFVQSSLILIKGLRFDQSLREFTKNLEKPYKYPYKSKKKKEVVKKEKYKDILCKKKNHSVKVHRPNIEGLASFGKNRKWKGKKKGKRREVTTYS